jgi:hypothetical protein
MLASVPWSTNHHSKVRAVAYRVTPQQLPSPRHARRRWLKLGLAAALFVVCAIGGAFSSAPAPGVTNASGPR